MINSLTKPGQALWLLILLLLILLCLPHAAASAEQAKTATQVTAADITALYEAEAPFAEEKESGEPAINEAEDFISFSVPPGTNGRQFGRLYRFTKEGAENHPSVTIIEYRFKDFATCVHFEIRTATDATKLESPAGQTCMLPKELTTMGDYETWAPIARQGMIDLMCAGEFGLGDLDIGKSEGECRTKVGDYFDLCTGTANQSAMQSQPTNEDEAFQRGDDARICVVANARGGAQLLSNQARTRFMNILASGEGVEEITWTYEPAVYQDIFPRNGYSAGDVTGGALSITSVNANEDYSAKFGITCSHGGRENAVLGNDFVFTPEPSEDSAIKLHFSDIARSFSVEKSEIGDYFTFRSADTQAILSLLLRAEPGSGMLIEVVPVEGESLEYVFGMVGAQQMLLKTLVDCKAIRQP